MRTAHAFSLVELLVVIAIIALLIGVLVPALSSARASARSAVCLANLRTVGQGVLMYADASRDHFPLSSHTVGNIASPIGWLESLQPFGVPKAVRLCPLDPARAQRSTSYATNEHMEPLVPGIDFNPITRRPLPGGRTRAFVRLGLVPQPAATIYVYEPTGEGSPDHLHTHRFASADDVARAVAVTRHAGGAHFLFADGRPARVPWPVLRDRFAPATSPFDPAVAMPR